jgi:hypothetical protein
MNKSPGAGGVNEIADFSVIPLTSAFRPVNANSVAVEAVSTVFFCFSL